MSSRFSKISKVALAAFSLVFILSVGTTVLAQAAVDTGIDYGAGTGLASTDIRIIIAKIIRVALGLLGVVLLGLVIYSGVLYMTAGGNEEQIETSKKYLKNAAIGLAIILSAFAIVQFVISQFTVATTGGTGPVVDCTVYPADPACLAIVPPGPGGPGVFYSRMAPVGQQTVKNIVLSFSFYQGFGGPAGVSFNTINRDSLKIFKFSDPASQPPGEFKLITANLVEFQPTGSCVDSANPSNSDSGSTCFEKNTRYTVQLTAAIKATDNRVLTCSSAHPCNFEFTSGEKMDREPPAISIFQPAADDLVSADSQITVGAGFTDDAGVKLVQFFHGDRVLNNTNIEPVSINGLANATWSTIGLSGAQELKARAYDVDNHNTLSSPVRVRVLPAHCFDGVQNFDEIGKDCGGPSCATCDGGACTGNADCVGGFCLSGVCVSRPKITNVSPLTGAVGNYITIYGRGFGTYSGTNSIIKFLGQEDTAADDKIAEAVQCFGEPSWKDGAIVVKVPAGAVSGPVQIGIAGLTEMASTSLKQDKTNDNYGPVFPAFIVGGNARPGLCGVRPAEAGPLSSVDLEGTRLAAASNVYFGTESVPFSNNTESRVSASVPNLQPQTVSISVKVAGAESNSVPFRVLATAENQLPRIDDLDPKNGPVGTFVTITGANFGSSMPEVWFQLGGDKKQAFKPDCAVVSGNQLLVKVPDGLGGEGRATVTVITAGGTSGSAIFIIDTTPLRPGLCSLEPNNGPTNTLITLVGENFGNSGNVVYGTQATSTLSAVSWTSGKVTDRVPTLTGASVPVKIWNGKLPSNSLNFKIGDCSQPGNACVAGKVCCEGVCRTGTSCVSGPKASVYSWYFSTGRLPVVPGVVEDCDVANGFRVPSPSPALRWDGGENVCLNVFVITRFATLVKSVDSASFVVEKCADRNCASGLQVVPGSLIFGLANGSLANGYLGTAPIYDAVGFSPLGAWSANTWYRVRIGTGVRSFVFGSNGLENVNAETGLPAPYVFQFKTGTENCALGKAVVSPDNFTSTSFNTTYYPEADKNLYSVSALAQGNNCLAIDPAGYNWAWNAGDRPGITAAYAEVSNDMAGGLVSPNQDLKTKNEVTPTAGGKVWVSATVNGAVINDDAVLKVAIASPAVIDYWPVNCNAVCSNAEVAAVFNVSLNAASLNNYSVKLCEVPDPNSTACVPVSGYSWQLKTTRIENDTILFEHPNFKPGVYYRVVLRGYGVGVSSAAGRYLNPPNLNYDDQGRTPPLLNTYSWYFRTKTDDKICGVNSVTVVPETSKVGWVGATAPVAGVAWGAKDECSLNGQRLNSWAYNWGWLTNPANVATVSAFDRGQGASAVSLACSDSCLHPGRGATAVGPCGGAIVGAVNGLENSNFPAGYGTFSLNTARGSVAGSLDAKVEGETNYLKCVGNYYQNGLAGLSYCANATSTYSFSLPTSGTYSVSIYTGNNSIDFGAFAESVDDGACATQPGIQHHLRVFWDGVEKANVCRPASLTPQAFSVNLGTVEKGNHKIRIVWDNDFIKDGRDSNLVVYQFNFSGRCEGPVTALCGNGQIDIGEDCDPAMPAWRNSCNEKCLRTGGVINAGTEACTANTRQDCCGNGITEYNESCDLGSENGWEGSSCTSRCLNAGTKMSVKSCLDGEWFISDFCYSRGVSLCGDGLVSAEAGEECDAGVNNGKADFGCSASCLKTAKVIGSAGAAGGYCGDGQVDSNNNEECDGERWCSSTCQNLGSSYAYGSFCGDSAVGSGEDCDVGAGVGDGLIDPWQLVKAIGQGTVNAQKQQVADITATAENKTGTGKFILQCGYTPGEVCSCDLDGHCLVGDDSCCYPQPTVSLLQPTITSNVCPNTAIGLQFSDVMSQPTFSSSTRNGFYNLILAKQVESADGSCQANSIKVADAPAKGGHWWLRVWSRVRGWFGNEAGAVAVFCDKGSVQYKLEFAENTFNGQPATLLTLKLDKPLDNSATYRLYIKPQVKSNAGVGVYLAGSEFLAEFSTLNHLCAINKATVEPSVWWFNTNQDNPSDNNAQTAAEDVNIKDADKVYTARAVYNAAGVNQELQPLPGIYDWNYTWSTDDTAGRLVALNPLPTVASQKITVPATNPQNGTAEIRSRLTITVDTSSQATTGKTFDVRGLAQIFLCENPWPNGIFNEYYGLGLVDAERNNNSVIPGMVVPGMWSNWTNLKLLYCRDAGRQNDMSDDLPKLNLPVVISNVSTGGELLKEFFFTFADPEPGSSVKNDRDSIGVRVYKNLKHLSLPDWYKAQNLTGTPTALKVGNHDALQVGRTYYIDALNISGSTVYSNVYVFTFSDEPIAETVEVVNQLLANLVLNVNVINPRVCLAGTTETTQACSKDLDCATGQTCNAPLDKLYRDYTRLKDLQLIATKLWAYKQTNGEYPRLDENPTLGTYLPSYTNDKWRSWQGVLGNALGYTLPKDPVDNFYGCGSGVLADYDAGTCWNEKEGKFVCPVRSHIYQYQVNSGTSVKLKADFEGVTGYNWMEPLSPPDGTISYQSVNSCNEVVQGMSSVCGDGVVGAGTEVCEVGQKLEVPCTAGNGYPGIKTYQCRSDCSGYNISSVPGVAAWWPADNDGQELIGGRSAEVKNGAGFTAGKYGQAFNFPQSPNNSYVLVNDPLVLSSNFSIGFWINPRFLTYSWLFGYDPANGGGGLNLGLTTDGRLTATAATGQVPGGGYIYSSVQTVSDTIYQGSWQYVVFAFSKETGVKFYVGGYSAGLAGADSWRGKDILYGSSPQLLMGGRIDNPMSFKGAIDEVKIFSRVLSQAEIIASRNEGSAGGVCQSGGACGNGIKEAQEECDDGVENGKYGKCSTKCLRPVNNTPLAESAGFCGNTRKDVAEVCDATNQPVTSTLYAWCSDNNLVTGCHLNSAVCVAATPAGGECVRTGGRYNYEKLNSCSWDCQSFDYCGDGKLNAKYEACEKSESCTVGNCSRKPERFCETDSDCQPAVCIGTNCGIIDLGTCSNKRTGKRYCKSPNEFRPNYSVGSLAVDDTVKYTAATCSWETKISVGTVFSCLPTMSPPPAPGVCGDGVTDTGEVCDAGGSPPNGNGYACTPSAPITSCTFCAYGCQEVITVTTPTTP